MPTTLEFPSARGVSRLLLCLMVSLLTLSTLGQISRYCFGHPRLMGLVDAFYIDYEANVSAWFSSLMLGAAGLMLAMIGVVRFRQQAAYAVHWLALALLFVGLSADEIAGFHELAIDPLRRSFGLRGLLYFGWVVPGALFVLAVGCAMGRFLAHLPRSTLRAMLVAGFVFVGGAIGVEMLSGAAADAWGEENIVYALIVTIEEALEMLGVILLIHALVDYIHAQLGGLRIVIGAHGRAEAAGLS